MKLFKISQEVNNDYDTYSDAIVCAKDKNEAKAIHPNGYDTVTLETIGYDTWCDLSHVKVEYIGVAKRGIKKGMICQSFHAG